MYPPSAHHVVIVGNGFGGVYVAKRLTRHARRGTVRVTLIGATNHFLFTPLLHEVATGALSPLSITEPLREIFAGDPIAIRVGTVRAIHPASNTVVMQDDTLTYDSLVIATGAVTQDFHIPGVATHGLPLKTLNDAQRIRNRVLTAIEAIAHQSSTTPMPSFIVVGGGPTAVELAAELAEFIPGILERYHADRTTAPTISLVTSGDRLLPGFSPFLQKTAARRLTKKGIALRCGNAVTAVEADHIVLKDGAVLPADLVLWAAGVKPDVPAVQGITPSASGRLAVDATLAVVGAHHLYALGDAAEEPTRLPMLAQVAVSQARTVADNILATIHGSTPTAHRYRSRGTLVSLGQWYAVGEIFFAPLRGRFAWWLWRTVYLFKFLSWRKRIHIAFEWTVALFCPRDITHS